MPDTFMKWLADGHLVFIPEKGIGYYNVEPCEYAEDYFEKYRKLAETEIGKALASARVDLVNKYTHGEVVDIGIGSGAFIEARGAKTYGDDINEVARNWLDDRCLLRNLADGVESACFWDSLEHFEYPEEAVSYVDKYCFISMPIYRDAYHVLKSKHYRKDEHYWYFTKQGLIDWMDENGFDFVEYSDIETRIGREDIGSFVFKRRST